MKYKGLASRIIAKIMRRHDAGLCTLKQMNFLQSLGYSDTANITRDQASQLIDAKIGKK